MTRVFISHATPDRELVETAIVTLLNRHGITTWYAKEQISTGVQWEKKIREGLESCDYFLVALTPRAIASEWVRSETDWAIENRAGRIVPVLLERCDPGQLHLRLRLLQFVDFRKRDEEEKIQLLGAWDTRPEADPDSTQGSSFDLARFDDYLYARPKNWHCIFCGWACTESNNDYICKQCNQLRPFAGGSATMKNCRNCDGFSLAVAEYCEWCGQHT